MQEKVFYDDEDVKVTNARIVTEGQTFAVRNVSSVRCEVIDGSKDRQGANTGLGCGGLMLVGGIAALFTSGSGGMAALALGGGVLFVLVSLASRTKDKATLILVTNAGEARAVERQGDGAVAQIEAMVAAVNDAMVHGQ